VPEVELARRIAERALAAGLACPPSTAAQLAAYLSVLGMWNRRINLTALPVAPPSDSAIDRLVLEPLLAARALQAADRLAVDVGSGGGSPALPLKIAAPYVRMLLIEARTRKSAFLREAIRQLALADTTVETGRAEELAHRRELSGQVDVITIRGVRADPDLWRAMASWLCPSGRLLWFGDRIELNARWEQTDSLQSSPALVGPITVLRPVRQA
jgi:16S rRNA (guanine527-N7)-methyltransferase